MTPLSSISTPSTSWEASTLPQLFAAFGIVSLGEPVKLLLILCAVILAIAAWIRFNRKLERVISTFMINLWRH